MYLLRASEGYAILYGMGNIDRKILKYLSIDEGKIDKIIENSLSQLDGYLKTTEDCGFVLAILNPSQHAWEPFFLERGFIKQKAGYNSVHAHNLSLFVLHRPRR